MRDRRVRYDGNLPSRFLIPLPSLKPFFEPAVPGPFCPLGQLTPAAFLFFLLADDFAALGAFTRLGSADFRPLDFALLLAELGLVFGFRPWGFPGLAVGLGVGVGFRSLGFAFLVARSDAFAPLCFAVVVARPGAFTPFCFTCLVPRLSVFALVGLAILPLRVLRCVFAARGCNEEVKI